MTALLLCWGGALGCVDLCGHGFVVVEILYNSTYK